MPRKPRDPNAPKPAMNQPPDYSLTVSQRVSFMFRLAMESGLFAKGKVVSDEFDDDKKELALLTETNRRLRVSTLAQLADAITVAEEDRDEVLNAEAFKEGQRVLDAV